MAILTVGIDLAKNVFALHGVNEAGKADLVRPAVPRDKLARLTYAVLSKGEEYTDAGQDYFEERYRERVVRHLNERAKKLGMKLVPAEQPA